MKIKESPKVDLTPTFENSIKDLIVRINLLEMHLDELLSLNPNLQKPTRQRLNELQKEAEERLKLYKA